MRRACRRKRAPSWSCRRTVIMLASGARLPCHARAQRVVPLHARNVRVALCRASFVSLPRAAVGSRLAADWRMNRGCRIVLGAAAALGVAWACDGETRAPAALGAEDGGGGTDPIGNMGGTSGAGGFSELDAGAGVDGNRDASISGTTEPQFCAVDGRRFTTYRFPSGEPVQSFDIEPLRSFQAAVGVDGCTCQTGLTAPAKGACCASAA